MYESVGGSVIIETSHRVRGLMPYLHDRQFQRVLNDNQHSKSSQGNVPSLKIGWRIRQRGKKFHGQINDVEESQWSNTRGRMHNKLRNYVLGVAEFPSFMNFPGA